MAIGTDAEEDHQERDHNDAAAEARQRADQTGSDRDEDEEHDEEGQVHEERQSSHRKSPTADR